LADKSGDSGFVTGLLSLLHQANDHGAALGDLASLAEGNASPAVSELGNSFLTLVLGGDQSAIASQVSGAAGLKPGSVSSLLSLAAPMVVGFLGRKAQESGLNAGSLGNLLAGQAASPQGHSPAPPLESKPGSNAWILPLLLIAGLAAALWWFLGQKREPVQEAAEKAADSAVNTSQSMWAALGDLFKRKLPNGVELSIPKLGVETRVIDFIEDASKPIDKTTWFDFDRLLFDTGKATLQPASQEQLGNIAQILKAFPKVAVKLGGYTDNRGDQAFNMKLSADRANNVMVELVKLGVEPARLSAEGYGDQHPVASNDTEEGRAKNRRISMRLTAK
jgi:outer membrane protein OmpA-like peptidoglycan-associated protein